MIKKIYFILPLVLIGCHFPEDPNRTLLGIEQSHLIRVGHCPLSQNKLKEIEYNFVLKLANKLHAQINWDDSIQEQLYQKLEHNDLDLVTCAIIEDSPWKEELSFTTPFYKNENNNYVIALPPGENGWLHYVNQNINEQKS